jgi:hypothetical protein
MGDPQPMLETDAIAKGMRAKFNSDAESECVREEINVGLAY